MTDLLGKQGMPPMREAESGANDGNRTKKLKKPQNQPFGGHQGGYFGPKEGGRGRDRPEDEYYSKQDTPTSHTTEQRKQGQGVESFVKDQGPKQKFSGGQRDRRGDIETDQQRQYDVYGSTRGGGNTRDRGHGKDFNDQR